MYVYLSYFLCATHDLLFLFSCYFIRDACTAVRVAQRVCVYEWTIIDISGIVIANIYCMYIVIVYGKVCMVMIYFVLIVRPGGSYDSPIFISPYKLCHIFLPISFIHARFIHCTWACFLSRSTLLSPFSLPLDMTNNVFILSAMYPVCK